MPSYVSVSEGASTFSVVVAKRIKCLAAPILSMESVSSGAFQYRWDIVHAAAVPSMERLALETELGRVLGVTAIRVQSEILLDVTKRGTVLLRDLWRAGFATIIPMALTTAVGSQYTPDYTAVSRRELVAALSVLIQSGRMRISDGLAAGADMAKQIEALRAEKPGTVNDETQEVPEESFAVAMGMIAWRIDQLGELNEAEPITSPDREKPYNPATFGLTDG